MSIDLMSNLSYKVFANLILTGLTPDSFAIIKSHYVDLYDIAVYNDVSACLLLSKLSHGL